MAFASVIHPKEFIIDDNNYGMFARDNLVVDGDPKSRGRIPRDYDKEPFGASEFYAPFPDDMVIPEENWKAMAEELERTKSRLSDIVDRAGLICKDQDGLPYCWCNGATHSFEIARAVMGLPTVLLSSASVGGPVSGWRKVGGWGTAALKQIIQVGAAPASIWGNNDVNPRLYTEENKAVMAKYRCLEWYELKPRSFAQLVSCLLQRIPVAIGLNWWSHEVTAYDVVVMADGSIGVRFRNSWGMGWGDRGYSILTRAKATPDDAIAPRVARAFAADGTFSQFQTAV